MNEDLLVVKKYVSRARSRLIHSRLLRGISPAILIFLILSILLDIVFVFYPWIMLPVLWDVSILVIIIFIIGWIIDSEFIHAPDNLHVASFIENQGGLQHSLLSIALEFNKTGQKSPFVERTFKIAASQIHNFPYVRLKIPVSFWISLLLLPVWFVLVFKLEPSLSAFWKISLVNTSISGTTVSPGSVKIGQNGNVTLTLIPGNTILPSCRLILTRFDNLKRHERFLLRPDSTGNFSATIDSVKKTFVYQFFYGGEEFPPETVTVVPPPSLYNLQLKLIPPLYTGNPVKLMPEGRGDVKVYSGTKIEFSIESDELYSASLVSGKDTVAMEIRKNEAYSQIIAYKETEYSFVLIDSMRQKSDSLPVFHIDIISDELPVVHFLKPGFNSEVSQEQVETLWVEGIDDLGIKSLKIYSSRNGDLNESASVWDISPEGFPKNTRKELIWNLNKYSLYPGDTLFYWAKIQDNKPYLPYGVSYSDTFWFRVPNFQEIHERILEKENYTEEKVRDVRQKQDNLNEMLEDLIKSATDEQQQLSWDQQQILNDVQKTIEAQSDSLNNALKSLEENVEKLKQQGDISEQITDKMDQIQKELKDLLNQFGDSLLQNFKENGSIPMDQMRNAIEDLQKMLPELNARLDNTLQFLEMLRKDRQLAAMAMRADQLANQQNQLARQKQSVRNIEQQKDLLSEIDKYNRELKNSYSDNEQISSSSENLENLGKQMQSEMSKGQSPLSEQQNQMSASLMSISRQLNEMMSSTKMKQMQKEKMIIMDMAGDLLDLADWQQALIHEKSNKELRHVVITQQAIHNALKKVGAKADSLKAIPPVFKNEISKELLNVIQNSSEIVLALEDSGIWAMKDNKVALFSLSNKLLNVLKALKQQAQNQNNGSGGLMDALRNLSGTQAAINSATAEILRSLLDGSKGKQGERGGGTDSDAMKASRDAQKALAEQLKKLAQKYGNEAGGGVNQRLEQLEQEARKIANMLEQPQPDITKHQDRFLSRLLQTTLSMNRQGEGKEERKSKAAEKIFSTQNKIDKNNLINSNSDSFYLLRQKALMGNFPESYRESIKEYFDSLEIQFLNR